MTPNTADRSTLPMAGLRVLDFTIMMAGPYCTRMMADMGAEVIKVEPPEGDQMRAGIPLRDGASSYFGHLNAGKKSVVLDLKDPQGRQAALDLAAKVDVVVENFRPGVLARFGLDYERVRALNPSVVCASISGYGQTGPFAGRPSFAPIIHAACGIDLATMGHQALDQPPPTGIFTADVLTAVFGLVGIQAALAMREATGQGRQVDTTMFESMLNLMPYEVQEAQFPQAARVPYGPVRASDGFVILMVLTQANFANLCDAIGRPDLKLDPRFAQAAQRAVHRAAMNAEVEAWTAQRSAEQCELHFAEHGVPCSRYRSVRDNLDHPQLALRDSFATVTDAGGDFLVPKLPFSFGASRLPVAPGVPTLGADTDEVLMRVAGWSRERLQALGPRH